MEWNSITSLISLGNKLLPSITASALEATSSYSLNYITSQMGRARAAEENLEWLMRTLMRIEATQYDAEARESREDYSVKHWLKELKEVVYDVENVLSEYQYEVTRVQVQARKACQHSGFRITKQMERIVPFSDGMVDRLNKVRSRLDDIEKDRQALQLVESDGVRRPNNKRPRTGHMVDEASIFGRDAEKEEVIKFLLSEKEKSFLVVSIVGRGGLGKTTIAQLVYKDHRVVWGFDLFGWVCVSEEFDVGRLTKETIESFSNNNNGVTELRRLQDELAKIVKGKRILLVLDDVWNDNQSLWESFQVPFKEAEMVRILVTTRNKKVAKMMQTIACCIPPDLPEDSCWQLFQHCAFMGTSHTVPIHFVDMGREIVRKCGGLPLAVKSIAGLLRHETDEESWIEILESELWETNPSNDIFPALAISYAHLPAHLKPCFLFCSTYPKDYLLKKMNLIELWISHGYIESTDRRRIIEIGVEYYEELKDRFFLDDLSGRSSECCKLHDIIHDLARINSEYEHHSVVINQPLNTQKRNVPQEARHLYARGFVGYVNQIPQICKGLRTLSTDLTGCSGDLEHEYCINDAEAVDLNPMLSKYDEECSANLAIGNLTKFEGLKVLQLKGGFTKIPYIPELKHLVYLSITFFNLKMLPVSIGLLYNLQTLILDCPSLEDLPESIGDLANLQFLNIQSRKVKKLSESLCSLSNLLRLVLRCDQLEEFPSNLRNLSNLHGLTILSNQIKSLPIAIGFLGSLEEFKLMPLHGSVKKNHKLDYVPYCRVNFLAIKTMAAWLRVRTIDWLKNMKNLEGKLTIEGLDKMSDLKDAQLAKLRNKCKLETLDLCWDSGNYEFPYEAKSELILSLKKRCKRCKNGSVGADDDDFSSLECKNGSVGSDDVDFSLLECLQPHPNLKKLLIKWYPSNEVPKWMKDPSSLQSIQEVWLHSCENIRSLPFGNFHTLKHLKIQACSSIQVVHLKQQFSQLENLQILQCGHLELITGLGDLKMLVALKIDFCKALKSIEMDGQQLGESTEPFGDSSHEMPRNGRQSISSLTRLEIKDCDLLHVLPDGLIPSKPCYVRVWDCGHPDISIGYRQ